MGAKETDNRWPAYRWLYGLLALAVPLVVASSVFLYQHTPVPEFFLEWHDEGYEPSVVYRVIPDSRAEAAGVRVGDIIVAEDGRPFPADRILQVGQVVTLGIERDGQRIGLNVPLVPMMQVQALRVIWSIVFALVLWGSSTLLLWRRFWQVEVRLLFLLSQSIVLFALYPPPELTAWCRGPLWTQAYLSGASVFWFPSLLLHYHTTFPVILGSPRRRRWVLGVIYGTALLTSVIWVISSAGWLLRGNWVWQLLGCYLVLMIGAAIGVIFYVYLRRSTPEDRRRLRLIVLGSTFAVGTFVILTVLPTIVTSLPLVPSWLAIVLLLVAPLSYFYATVQHGLFGIDRLLNRALVYAFLSLGIFALYLVPFTLLYRLLPGELLPQTVAVAGLTLLVGSTFSRVRTWVQRMVDRLFYGGWYDYPGVVETVSDALARSLKRTQLSEVLTRQVPELMQLQEGWLWVGEPGGDPQKEVLPAQIRFPLSFRGQVRAVWMAGPRQDGEVFSSDDRRILQTLAHQAEMALSSVLLVETLQGQLEEIRETQQRLLQSREEERSRLARELHDGPIQMLVGLNLELGMLSEEAAAGMRVEVRELLGELRQVCAELRPPMLDTLGLGAAVQALAEEWSAQHGVDVQLDLPDSGALRSLPDEVAVNLYRVVQEGLANVARHAGATHVTIRLAWEGTRLALTLHDDGRGFEVPDEFRGLAAEGHFGLAGMAERVALIGGEWAVESAPAGGTTMRVAWKSRD